MANKICSQCSELDEQGIAKRHELYARYVEPHYTMIYRLCQKYSFHPSNVDENYNEVLINFYLRIETYNPTRPLLTWLHIVTKRYIMDLETRRNKHSGVINEGDIGDEKIDVREPQKHTTSWLNIDNYKTMYSDEILMALDTMNPAFKKALLLQESGYALKEIAALEKCSIGTIKSRIFHARQHLKQLINRDGQYIKKQHKEDQNSI